MDESYHFSSLSVSTENVKRSTMTSLRLVPSIAPQGSVSTDATSHASFAHVHDAMRFGGPRSHSAEQSAPKHPLQKRLAEWEQTQDTLKMTLHRNAFGMHMPIRQMMERQLVSYSSALPSLTNQSDLHLDILRGKDESLDVSDVLIAAREERSASLAVNNDLHSVMERRLRL